MRLTSGRKVNIRKTTLVLVTVLTLLTACAAITINQDKAKAAGAKITGLALDRLVSTEVRAILEVIMAIIDSIEFKPQTSQLSIVAALQEKGVSEKTGISLKPYMLKNNVETIDATSFILRGSQGDSVVYFSTSDDKNGVLRDVAIEADVTVENIAADKSNNGLQTIAIGARGYKGSPLWRGYSFQLLQLGIMKVCSQADDNKSTCDQKGIGEVKAGNRYHMLLALKGKEAFITLFDYQTGERYMQPPCDLSDIQIGEEGRYVYLFAWKADVKFTNLHVVAL